MNLVGALIYLIAHITASFFLADYASAVARKFAKSLHFYKKRKKCGILVIMIEAQVRIQEFALGALPKASSPPLIGPSPYLSLPLPSRGLPPESGGV